MLASSSVMLTFVSAGTTTRLVVVAPVIFTLPVTVNTPPAYVQPVSLLGSVSSLRLMVLANTTPGVTGAPGPLYEPP
ncbi:MAG: hypothetical protein LBI16_05145 [Burkholderiales bacterium]|nr:hypothetical protein [Burkholderiales bacterium]